MARSSSSQGIRQGLTATVLDQWRASASTLVGLSAVLVIAVAGLFVNSSSTADSRQLGLAKLATVLPLVQAFQGDPSLTPPQLWSRRLGIKPAMSLWKRLGRGLWWQAWSADGQSYLVVPAWLWSEQPPSGVKARRLDGLVVISADALNQQQLDQHLASATGASPSSSPLQAACTRKLASAPSVQWQPEALDRLSGALSPLLQQARYGCLSLRVRGQTLQWQGWMGQRDFAAAPANLTLTEHFAIPELSTSDQPSSLLSLQGRQLGLLFNALASRDIIREPLERHYGLGQREREQMLNAPFRLRLLPQSQGAYQAGLQLQLWLAADAQPIQRSLTVLSGRLRDQGLRASRSGGTSWIDPDASDSQVIGGWFWMPPQAKRSVLSVGLGLPPSTELLPGLPTGQDSFRALTLKANPRQLSERNLFSGGWPRVVKQSPSLQLTLDRLGGVRFSSPSAWMELSGQLALAPAAAS